MDSDDFDIIVFKLLSYLYECLKQGVEPNGAKAQEVAGCNDTYFKAVLSSLKEDKMIVNNSIYEWGGTAVVFDVTITQAGARYLSENDRMKKVAKFLGKAFMPVLETAIKATMALT